MAEVDTSTPASAVSASGFTTRLLGAAPGRLDDVVAILNGLVGDELEDRVSSLAVPMTLRAGGTVLPSDREPLRDALDRAGIRARRRVCVLVHGLMSTESVWRLPEQNGATYGTLLADDHDMTVLTLRYNTGRRISTNGRELSRLLGDLVRVWPVRLREINLIGHSMGGLVIRSACHAAGRTVPRGRRLPIGRRWSARLRRVVLIGSPHTGAGLEGLVNSLSSALWTIPTPATRLVGSALDRRSAGIRDLRFGAILDEDWLEHDPDARDRPHAHHPVRLPRTRLLTIAGSVTTDPDHPVGNVLGDALVTSSSATGLSDDGEILPGATHLTFPTVTHISLAHHPRVYAGIADWW